MMLDFRSLLKVTVESEDGDSYEFPCNKWLAEDADDGKTSRELEPDTS